MCIMPKALTFRIFICLQTRIDHSSAIKLCLKTGRLSSLFYVMINLAATHLHLRQNCSIFAALKLEGKQRVKIKKT